MASTKQDWRNVTMMLMMKFAVAWEEIDLENCLLYIK